MCVAVTCIFHVMQFLLWRHMLSHQSQLPMHCVDGLLCSLINTCLLCHVCAVNSLPASTLFLTCETYKHLLCELSGDMPLTFVQHACTFACQHKNSSLLSPHPLLDPLPPTKCHSWTPLCFMPVQCLWAQAPFAHLPATTMPACSSMTACVCDGRTSALAKLIMSLSLYIL